MCKPYHLFYALVNIVLVGESLLRKIICRVTELIILFCCNYQLEKLINVNSSEIDWERSFYLNLVAHTSYTVTVAICRYVSLVVLLRSYKLFDS
jgi:hypothetical protein